MGTFADPPVGNPLLLVRGLLNPPFWRLLYGMLDILIPLWVTILLAVLFRR
ncbi:hypothetical protein HRbin23_01604 [bacterium HR23]|nr:hypothetical protein HRbin23_01604 [bacterium HR23]